MGRPMRDLQPGYTYHITVRCNNRRFNLNRPACRDVFLYAIEQATEKYDFKLYALCIMSNHVHYLLEPANPDDLPKIMHWLNWYTAMAFNRMLNRTGLNRMLNRTGHFWEARYNSTGFPTADYERALNTLRYIHANPKAAGICTSFRYRYSNYGTYAELGDDGLTEWHPAFYSLGDSLDECAERYRTFCKRYTTKKNAGSRRSHWGRRMLPDQPKRQRRRGKVPAGQRRFANWCQVSDGLELPEAVREVAERFMRANSRTNFAPELA